MATHESIERALNHVLGELAGVGLLTERLYGVEVVTQAIDLAWLTAGYEGCYIEDPGPVGSLAGYRPGTIYFPRATFAALARTLRLSGRRPTSMRDVLRHEYGHAFAVEHPSLVRRSRRFVEAFGGRYDDEEPVSDYAFDDYITDYAATNPSEDFAETFMTYVRVGGEIDRFRSRPGVHRKMVMVRSIAKSIRERGLVLAL